MISAVDQHIVSRLERITVGTEPLRVYPYMPGREQGETRFPCAALVLRGIFQSFVDARPNCEVVTERGDNITIPVSVELGAGTETGPPEYDFKPYPTPVELVYEVGAFATRVQDHRYLLEGIYQAFPPGYQYKIGDSTALFSLKDLVQDDDFEKPLFAKLLILRVSDLWLDRAEISTYISIRDIEYTTESID